MRTRGFTLLELLVVLVILGFAAAVVPMAWRVPNASAAAATWPEVVTTARRLALGRSQSVELRTDGADADSRQAAMSNGDRPSRVSRGRHRPRASTCQRPGAGWLEGRATCPRRKASPDAAPTITQCPSPPSRSSTGWPRSRASRRAVVTTSGHEADARAVAGARHVMGTTPAASPMITSTTSSSSTVNPRGGMPTGEAAGGWRPARRRPSRPPD